MDQAFRHQHHDGRQECWVLDGGSICGGVSEAQPPTRSRDVQSTLSPSRCLHHKIYGWLSGRETDTCVADVVLFYGWISEETSISSTTVSTTIRHLHAILATSVLTSSRQMARSGTCFHQLSSPIHTLLNIPMEALSRLLHSSGRISTSTRLVR